VRKIHFLCFYLLLAAACFAQQNETPKNIILLIGDGMGPSYVSASVVSLDNDSFRRFTTTGFSVTCSADKLVTDSAAGATAYSTGYKTTNGYIGLGSDDKPLETLLELAEKNNKSTGVVATSSVTHATPASFVAHQISRSMQLEIAKDFMDVDIDVVIGGGSSFFTPKDMGGKREDGLNLIDQIKSNGYTFIDDVDNLIKKTPEGKFYALLEKEALDKACDRNYTLGQLTQAAIENLSKNENGFVLMVEGSQIDWGGHNNDQDYLLSELKDFNTAINTALDFAAKDSSTLVIVVADHETGGMAITSGARDGSDLGLKFIYDHHTASMVGVFAYGPGESLFTGVQENNEVGQKLFKFIDPYYSFK